MVQVIGILLVVVLAVICGVMAWFYAVKGLWLPAYIGFAALPHYPKASYLAEDGTYRMVTGNEPVAWYMNHPAFQGNTHLLMNADDKMLAMCCRQSYRRFTLSMNRSLLVDGNIEAINYMFMQMNLGKAQFIGGIYSQEEIAADPWKKVVAGILYRGEPGKPLAIVAAGGGFAACMSESEGYPYAMALHQAGYSVFVLTYRVGAQLGTKEQAQRGVEATTDLAKTVRFFEQHVAEYGISMHNYAIFGSSAGGLMATAFAFSSYPHNCHEYGLPRPVAIFSIYGLHWDIAATQQDVGLAVFSVVGRTDEYGFGNVEDKLPALKKVLGEEKVDVTVYDNLTHGCCIGTGTVAEGWMRRAIAFWQANCH